MIIETRPAKLIAAKYDRLPFPTLGPVQEICFDLGITADVVALEVAGVVFQGYNDHQLVFEERWPARVVRQKTGEANLRVDPGTGIALRSLHFMLQGYEPLTRVDVTVLAQTPGQEKPTQAQLTLPVETYETKTDLHFPLRGAWWAIQGSDWSDRHKQEVFSQTYAMDFARLGADNQIFRGDGTNLEDHYSWDQPVYAPAGGKIAYVIFDLPDLAPGAVADPRMFRDDPRRYLGNAVALSHGNGEVSYFACLQQASLAVNEGELVKRGTLIGRIGNSGLSPGPHLHFHLMQGPNPFIDQGLPLKFSHFSAGGQFFEQPITVPTRMIVFGAEEATTP